MEGKNSEITAKPHEKFELIERIVPDTSVLIEGLLSDKISHKHIKTNEIIIHEPVIA